MMQLSFLRILKDNKTIDDVILNTKKE